MRSIVLKFSPLVKKLAFDYFKLLPPSVDRRDIIGAAYLGLVEALSKIPEDSVIRHVNYIRIRIRGAIIDELRKEDWLGRGYRSKVESGEYQKVVIIFGNCNGALSKYKLEDTDPELLHIKKDEERFIHKLINIVLNEREKTIIMLHYFEGIRFNEISRVLRISEPRVCQIHKIALKKLKKYLTNSSF